MTNNPPATIQIETTLEIPDHITDDNQRTLYCVAITIKISADMVRKNKGLPPLDNEEASKAIVTFLHDLCGQE
jgi:hypothetical protein